MQERKRFEKSEALDVDSNRQPFLEKKANIGENNL